MGRLGSSRMLGGDAGKQTRGMRRAMGGTSLGVEPRAIPRDSYLLQRGVAAVHADAGRDEAARTAVAQEWVAAASSHLLQERK